LAEARRTIDDSGSRTFDQHKSILIWQRYAEPIWTDIVQSDVLSHRLARAEHDERHISPLQLTPVRRCIDLWTNPGDVVLSPFAGIGTAGYTEAAE
jgi:DNA modification methylase